MLSGLGGYSKEYRVQRTNNSKCGSNAVVLLCFFYGKIVPLSGGRAACGGGGKVQPMRAVGAGPAQIYFLDRRTKLRLSECVEVYLHTKRAGAGSTKLKVHKVTSKQADSRGSKVNGLAVIDGRSHAKLCDNVEH